MARHIANVRVINRNRTGVYIIKPHQKIDQRGLSAARRSNNRHALTLLYVQIEILDQLFVRHIRKRHVIAVHIAFRIPERNRVLLFRNLRRRVDQLEQTRRARNRVLQLRDNAGNFIERLRVLIGIAQKARQHAHRHAAGQHRQRARQANARIYDRIDESRRRIRD